MTGLLRRWHVWRVRRAMAGLLHATDAIIKTPPRPVTRSVQEEPDWQPFLQRMQALDRATKQAWHTWRPS